MRKGYGDPEEKEGQGETYALTGRGSSETSQNQRVKKDPWDALLETFEDTFGKKGDWKELI